MNSQPNHHGHELSAAMSAKPRDRIAQGSLRVSIRGQSFIGLEGSYE